MTENNNRTHLKTRFQSLRNSSFDEINVNLKTDCLLNFLQIFSDLSINNENICPKRIIASLNVLVILSKDLLTKFKDNDCFITSVYSIVKYSLWHSSRVVRTAGLRCARYYLLNYRHAQLLLRMRIDYLLMRSLDLSYEDAINNQYRGNDDAERIHNIRLLYRLSLIAPKIFPSTLINTLASICLIDVEKSRGMLDLAIRPAIMIMCNLVIINPAISTETRILDALQAVIFNADGRQWKLSFRIIEAVLLTQLKLVVHSEWRDTLPVGYFNKTLTPFSILSKIQPSVTVSSSYQMNYVDEQFDFENMSISVICTILRSWPGLLYFCSSNNKPILSITGLLAVGCSEMRDRILDLLFQIFNIFCPPRNCSDFSSCQRAFSDQRNASNRPHWNLENDFLIAQCFDSLTYISPNRINILDNYEVVLLGVFVHNNLFEALANAVTDEKESTSARAGILLANISYKISILFPSDHTLSRRSDTAKLFNNPKSHKALLWIDHVHKDLEQYQLEITPFMTFIIQQYPNNNVNEDFILSKRYLQPTNIDEILDSSCSMTSPLSSKKNTLSFKTVGNNRLSALLDQVTRHCKIFDELTLDNNNKPFYDQWNWDLLLVLSRSLADSKLRVNFDKDLLNRVLNILMKFFIPQSDKGNENSDGKSFCKSFAALPLTWKHSSKAAFVITDIIAFYVEFYKNSEQLEDLNLFLSTIRSYLRGCLNFIICEENLVNIKEQYGDDISSTDSLFTEYDLNYKCSSFLILAVGRMSATDLGEAFLEGSGIVEIFKTLLDYSQSDIYTKLILGSLDYARPSLGRSLLSIATTSKNLPTRRYAIQFLRVLLRAKVPFFANWGVNLLLKQVHDSDDIVKKEAFDILQEACEDESVINNLSVDSMAILQLGFSGYMLFSRLLSLPFHFEKLENRKSIDLVLNTWHEKNYDLEYCKQLDEKLMEHFTNYEAPTDINNDPDEGRPSNKPQMKLKELILPCHPYSSLSAHKDGFDLLINRGFIYDCADMIAKENKNILEDQCCEIVSRDSYELQLRAKMLAICHITTSSRGLEWAITMEIPTIISNIAKLHPSLNVRGTGIICLGLIGSTPRGANILIGLHWMALRSDRFNKWPLLLDVYHHLYQSREEVKRQLHAGKQPFFAKTSNSFYSSSIDGYSDNTIDTWNNVGCSVFAMPLYSDEPEQRSRKVTYELLENDNDRPVKVYSKSVDDHIIRSKTATITSTSSANNMFTDDEKPSKFSKFLHRRDLSAGAASMFNVNVDDTDSSISPHDVLGIATMRRIQKKSRTGLFQNINPFNRFSGDQSQTDTCDQSFCNHNLDILPNIHSNSVSSNSQNKRRKKFSSLITPKSHLSKYRGLVVPINFNDLTINISPKFNNIFSQIPSSKSQNLLKYSELDNRNSSSQQIFTDAYSFSEKSSKHDDISKISECSREKKDNLTSFPICGTSGYISLEESSCVLDLALLAVDTKDDDINKTQRSDSDQPHTNDSNTISLRPRSKTTSNCGDPQKSNIFSTSSYYNETISIPNIIINVRDDLQFVRGNFPKIHDSRGGLIYHHEDYCLHVGCKAEKGETPENVVEFRKEILQAVNSLIALSPRTKKMEISLAKLKNKVNQHLWSDLCLYSEICILLSLYNYSRESRLYLQDLFISVPMMKLADDMKSCLEEFSSQTGQRSSQFTRL